MKNGIHNLMFKRGRKLFTQDCQVANGFRNRITRLYAAPTAGLGLSAYVWLAVMLAALGVFAFAPEHGLAMMAIAPALKIDLSGLGGEEKEFMEKLQKRVSIEGGESVTKKEMEDALKVYSELAASVKGVDFNKVSEFLNEKTGVMAKLLAQGTKITELEKKGGVEKKKDWKKMIKDEFFNDAVLKRLQAFKEREVNSAAIFGDPENYKAAPGYAEKVGTITTSVVTTDSGGNALLDLMSVEDFRSVNLQEPFIDEFCSVSRTSKPVYPYADYQPNTGDAGFTAENAAKSQMDLKVVVKTLTPKKVTGYSTLSTESVEDIPRMQSEATGYLLKKILLKRQYKILFGTGAGNDPVGVAGLAKTYNQAGLLDNNGAALAGSLILNVNGNAVQSPNLFDVIQACALQIYSAANYTDEAEYYPNLVILNPTDLAALKLKKNQFGQYLFPELNFNLKGGQTAQLGNLTILAKRQIPAGKIMIGDFTKLNIINYIDYTLRVGWINDNLTNNLFTMVGEQRLFTLIRNLDTNAFIYDDIATITGLITA